MQKRTYPKTVFRKKVFKGLFWTGFVLVFFLSVIAIVRVSNFDTNPVEAKQVQSEETKVNYALSEGAQSFAQNFAREYFDWQNGDEDKKTRVERLQPYLANGLDEQAGLSFEGMEWNSSLSTSQVWHVEETGADSSNITLRVEHILTKNTPQEAPSEEKTGPYEKYFVVPIQTDGASFVVHQIPYFISAPEKPKITSDTTINETENSKIQNSRKKLHQHLIHFLKYIPMEHKKNCHITLKAMKFRRWQVSLHSKKLKILSLNKINQQINTKFTLPLFFRKIKQKHRWFIHMN